MSSLPLPSPDWKDPQFVDQWKAQRRERLEAHWATHKPAGRRRTNHLAYFDQENETLTERARRLENGGKRGKSSRRLSTYQVPALIGKNSAGEFVFGESVARARPAKIAKAAEMFDGGLEKKAQREIACGLLGGEVVCRSGHRFSIAYECGNRYCQACGPRGANRLFSRSRDRLYSVAARLLSCGQNCDQCRAAREQCRLPHWPPRKGQKPKVVVAKLDFTLMNTGRAGPDLMRHLNQCIKRFCRAIERRFGISRSDYGLAYCDELGAGNTNAHAHGIYVGPWLPQERRELSRLWAEVTGRSSAGPIGLIVSIKYARAFDAGLYHAVKYPAKFAERSTPVRLAELEVIFHRVRRFHTIAAFYNPDFPDPEKPDGRKCPTCGEKLSEPKNWRPLWDLAGAGLVDALALTRELARARALAGPDPPA